MLSFLAAPRARGVVFGLDGPLGDRFFFFVDHRVERQFGFDRQVVVALLGQRAVVVGVPAALVRRADLYIDLFDRRVRSTRNRLDQRHFTVEHGAFTAAACEVGVVTR